MEKVDSLLGIVNETSEEKQKVILLEQSLEKVNSSRTHLTSEIEDLKCEVQNLIEKQKQKQRRRQQEKEKRKYIDDGLDFMLVFLRVVIFVSMVLFLYWIFSDPKFSFDNVTWKNVIGHVFKFTFMKLTKIISDFQNFFIQEPFPT